MKSQNITSIIFYWKQTLSKPDPKSRGGNKIPTLDVRNTMSVHRGIGSGPLRKLCTSGYPLATQFTSPSHAKYIHPLR